MPLRKLFLSISFFIFIFFLSKSSATASNFSTSYNVNYIVSESGKTKVLFNITLKNESENFYTSSYKISTGLKDMENIKASDRSGIIQPIVENTINRSSIEVNFNKNAIGLSEKQTFSISFDSQDIAKEQGNVWEINIPGFENQSDIEDININLTIPKSFGNATFVKNKSGEFKVNYPTYNFAKKDIGKSGIIMVFGEKQIFSFNLVYHLKNDNVFPVKTEIALPPTTNYQEISIKDISPRPKNVKVDQDGNWLAEFRLMPSQKIDVIARGDATLFSSPKKEDAFDLQKYLIPQKYWEKDASIEKLAKELTTPKEIYDYVVKTLSYDFSRVTESKPRLGAVKALGNPYSAVCLEFTDLFIAIARTAGIPAREVDGFAYTENSKFRPLSIGKDILHSWPEYYDKKLGTWIMVDPTWENTTGGVDYFNNLDFNHVAFVIKGIESEYPVPAGGYKLKGNENLKDVDVKFSKSEDFGSEKIEITSNIPKFVFPGFPIKGSVIVKNNGNLLSGKNTINIHNSSLSPKEVSFSIDKIPPLGYVQKEVSFSNVPILTNKQIEFTIQSGNQTVVKKVTVSPFFIDKKYIIGGAVEIAAISLGLIFIIRRRKKKAV